MRMLVMNLTVHDNQILKGKDQNHRVVQSLRDKNLASLVSKGFLIFPNQISDSNDLTKADYIFQTRNTEIWTCNMTGILGQSGDSVRIHSRFTSPSFDEDYFLRYMIEKVLNYNVVDHQLNASKEQGYYDLLIFLFPYYLNAAMRKGLYKEYVTREYNNSNVKGSIHISHHLRDNIPFTGKIAYQTREFSFDNPMMRLVRHTIEHIEQKAPEILLINDSTRKNVSVIKNSIRNFTPFDRQSVIQENISKSIAHPYYLEYSNLQKVCLQIILEEKSIFYDEEQKINGILIDVAWLWEQYIWKVTNWQHYERGSGSGGFYLFKGSKKGPRYPDFTVGQIPIDTKYKKQLNTREDYNQMITYMYILQNAKTERKYGVFLQPFQSDDVDRKRLIELGSLNGHGGFLYSYNFLIPQEATDYIDFIHNMKYEEEKLNSFCF